MVSMYFFPFGFTFLPSNINSKNLCAFLGFITAVFDGVRHNKISVNKPLLGAILIVTVYSIIGYIAIDINNTNDTSYANYFVSFSVWSFGAYFACSVIKRVHGIVNIRLITMYLAGIGFSQCVLAYLINSIPAFKSFVNLFIDQGQSFLDEIGRWYGIGAALDPAGVRFCIIVILIAAVLTRDSIVRSKKSYIFYLVICFFTIVLIGNIISRTTTIGSVLALVYILLNGGLLKTIIKVEAFKFYFIFGGLTLLTIFLGIYLYNNDPMFHKNLRYGFEGFFNWIETGEWTTGSTEKLNNEMWIWPTTDKAWLIGTGYFDGWIYSTDIGYCRLILYNGLIGFSVFASFFVYNALVFMNYYSKYIQIFLIFIVLTFVIWIKVSTDIYQIWAMLYMITLLNPNELKNENSLLH